MDKHLLKELSAAYQWNEPVLDTINSGLINHTWKVQDEDRHFLLQSINTDVFGNPQGISSNLEKLAQYFRETAPGYLFTAPVYNRAGDTLTYAGGKWYRVFNWVQGSHTLQVVEKPDQAYEAAQSFALFTRLLEGFNAQSLYQSLPGFHNLSLRFRQFELGLQDGNNQRINAAKDMIKYLQSKKEIVKKYELYIANKYVNQRVTHHDTKISNILFDDQDKGLCVIDLDTVMPGYFLSDVGDMIRTYVCPVSEEEPDLDKIIVRKDFIQAIEEGYLRNMGDELSSFERDHFYFAGSMLIYMQALRFLTDHIQNDAYYGARYPGHNGVRSANQSRLLALFEEAL